MENENGERERSAENTEGGRANANIAARKALLQSVGVWRHKSRFSRRPTRQYDILIAYAEEMRDEEFKISRSIEFVLGRGRGIGPRPKVDCQRNAALSEGRRDDTDRGSVPGIQKGQRRPTKMRPKNDTNQIRRFDFFIASN